MREKNGVFPRDIGYGSYAEYLASDHWKEMVELYRREKCFCCGRKKKLHLHHNTYDRLGKELATDFITVCKECHSRIHKLVERPGSPIRLESAHFSLIKRIARKKRKTRRKHRRQARRQS